MYEDNKEFMMMIKSIKNKSQLKIKSIKSIIYKVSKSCFFFSSILNGVAIKLCFFKKQLKNGK